MSVPDPFSTANSLKHIISPKIVGPSGGSYQVAVDLVDIDTIHVKTLHYVTLDPPVSGGGGGTTGGTGATGPTGATGLRGFTGASGTQGVTGPPGAGSSFALTGTTGQLAYFNASGLTSSPYVVYDPSAQKLTVPTLDVVNSTHPGILEISTYDGDVYLQSGLYAGSDVGNSLYITAYTDTQTPAFTANTISNRVGINNWEPTTTLDVSGQTTLTYSGNTNNSFVTSGVSGSATLAANRQYVIYAWGGGGDSSGGTGGAGGYLESTVVVGATPGTLSWLPTAGGPGGGGNALNVQFNGSDVIWVPGGGAGATGGGVGAAAGRMSGIPFPEGGVSSAPTGGTGGFAIYTDLTDWKYSFGTTGTSSGVTFSSGSIGGVTAIGSTGTYFTFSPAAIQSTVGATATYTAAPGTFISFNTSGIVFAGSTFTSNNSSIQSGVVPSAQLINGTPTTGVTGSSYVVYDPYPGTTLPTLIGSPTVYAATGSTFSVASGDVSWNSGSVGFTAGSTFTIVVNGGFTDTGNTNVLLTAYTNIYLSSMLPPVTGEIYTSGAVTIPSQSTVDVSRRLFVNRGATASGHTGSTGGGGGYIGGGSAARVVGVSGMTGSTVGNMPAGGGAGSWFITGTSGLSISSSSQTSGNGIFPRTGVYNPTAVYARGGALGLTGGSPFLALELISSTPTTQPALIVNGDSNLNGNLTVSGSTATTNNLIANGLIKSSTDVFSNSLTLVPPAGSIMMFAGSTAPTGWFICDGTSYNTSTYSRLFGVIGGTFGGNLPDMRSRVPVGNGQGAGLSNYTLGSAGGLESVTLDLTQIPSHSHRVIDGQHFHTYLDSTGNYGLAAADGGAGNNRDKTDQTRNTAATTSNITIDNSGGGLSHENRQPYIALNYIIKW